MELAGQEVVDRVLVVQRHTAVVLRPTVCESGRHDQPDSGRLTATQGDSGRLTATHSDSGWPRARATRDAARWGF